MINIGMLGLGTVGTGVVEILEKRKDEFKSLVGQDINLKKVLVKDSNKKRRIDLNSEKITSNFDEILEDKDISIVIEVTGDLEKSYDYITKALNAGKHIVTANKAVVSKYFEELSSLAKEKDLAFLYEASVGGGVPILKPLKEQTALNKIKKVEGILNGTCNYILSRMANEGLDYTDTLKIAQELGYAEADPSSDVEGQDTLRKLRILSTLALNCEITENDILLNGINNITSVDIEQIRKMDSTIKLIGKAEAIEDGFIASVQPTIIKNNSYFANVNLAFNSIAFKGDNVGELMFYGPGAGKFPTANAVLSDVMDILTETVLKVRPLGTKRLKNLNSRIKGSYYLRVSNTDNQIIRELKEITEKQLVTGKYNAIITKEVLLQDVYDLLHKVHKDNYFLAKILN